MVNYFSCQRVAGYPIRSPQALDTKPYIEHHPIFGYRYIPGTNLELPRPGGGCYRIKINSQGIRSDREYSLQKPRSVRRIVVCGDSMAAGQFISNTHRFTELLERRIPGLEVINLALDGSGTDQQLLLYEHVGVQFEHDLVILLPFLQNIRRNLVEAREGIDPKTGQIILRPKPRYELVDGKLILRNVPVPKDMSSASVENTGGTDSHHDWKTAVKSRLSTIPGATAIRKALYAIVPWEPFPEYLSSKSAEWQLMNAILLRFKELAKHRPLVIVPTFYSNYVRFRMARNYWERYSNLRRTPGIHVVDILPYFRCDGVDGIKCFQDPYDMHFSNYGHLVLAEALEDELLRLNLLPSAESLK